MAVSNKTGRRLRRALRRLFVLCVFVAALLLVWQYLPVELRDPARLGFWLDRLDASPWAGPIVVAAFLVGSLIVFPVTVLIAATGIALGPSDGLIWALAASLIAATVSYALARMLPEEVLDDWIGPWIRRVGMRFERSGIVSVMVARNIPIAPFTLVNVMAGAAGINFRDYMIGTILGMGPTIVALTILGDRLRGVLVAPSLLNVLLLIAAILIWFVIGLGLQILSNRLATMRR